MGLGSVWINDVLFVEPQILDFLKITKEDSEFRNMLLEFGEKAGIEIGYSGPLVAAIALGYPDEDPKRNPSKTVEEVTIWYA
jgi:nitroreductase